MALFIIGLILGVGCFAYFFYKLNKFIKEKTIGQAERKIDGKERNLFMLLALGQGLLTITSSFGLVSLNNWSLNGLETFWLILGSYVFGTGFSLLTSSFYLYYYCVDLDQKQKKVCRILTFSCAVITLIGLLIFTEGIGNQDIYPLINRIDFEKGLVSNVAGHRDVGSAGGVQFYGIILVSGALVCFFITDHETYKKFGEHGLIDTLFIVAFLAGVIGSRLWYCLILEPEEFLEAPLTIITGMVDGGLAIQGGAIGGAIVGIAFVLLFRKYIDVRFLMDVAIPSILLAQAIGRWGNFFNQEVYGATCPDWLVNILPTIVKNQMFIYKTQDYRVPLFLIESMINFGGFFFIRYFLGKVCKFHLGLGYQSAAYLTWYGLVRFILEPLREGFTLEVGSSKAFGYMQSWIAAICMIIGGILLFIAMFVLHKYRFNKGLEDQFGNKIKKELC